VAVAAVEGVRQRAALERGDDLGDPLRDRQRRLEAELAADLLEADLVVARVLVAVHEADLAAVGQLLADRLDEVELAVVLGRASGVEDLAGDAVGGRVEHGAYGAGGVADVDVGAPELLAE